MGLTEAAQWAIPTLVVLYIVWRGLRVRDQQIGEWADCQGVRLTEANRPSVVRYLKWTRRCRTFGGLAGFLVPILYSLIVKEPFVVDNGLVLILTGYLVGAVLAEVVVHRPSSRWGEALLVPRRLGDYVPRYVILLQRGLALAAVALAGLYVLTAYPNRDIPRPEVLTFVLYGAAGLGVAVVVEALQRLIVSRPQPAMSAERLRADDAIRSTSILALAGAGVGLLLIVVGFEISVFSALEGSVGWSLALLSAFLYFSALFFWLDLGKPQGHRVRRLPKAPEAV